MAKKQKKDKNSTSNAPSSPDVVVQNPLPMIANNVGKVTDATATAANSGKRIGAAGDLGVLMSGGANILNPQASLALDSYTKKYGPQSKDILSKQKLSNDIADIDQQIASGLSKNGKPLTANQIKSLNAAKVKLTKSLTSVSTKLDNATYRLTTFKDSLYAGTPKVTDILSEAYPEAKIAANSSAPILAKMGTLGASGERLMGALGQGYQAGTIGSRDVTASQMGPIANISSGQVGLGALGQTLMGRAMGMANSTGLLNDQAARDAVQSARQGFAARGLGTSGASMAAELLNRDRYSRQRMFQDLEFAGKTQDADIRRQEGNRDAALRADEANQTTAFNTASFNTGQQNTVASNNANRALDASIANENARVTGNQTNIGMLGDAYNTERQLNQDALTAVNVKAGLDAAANPNTMLMKMYSGQTPYADSALTATTNAANSYITTDAEAQGFNINKNLWQNSLGYADYKPQPNYLTGSQWGDFALNTGVKAGTTAILAASDRRLKENIKPLGSAAGILGLKAYKFDYKDGKKGVVGLMAQDVQKVLPQAVKTIMVDGKKRLAIKPQVIGAALARELSRAAA